MGSSSSHSEKEQEQGQAPNTFLRKDLVLNVMERLIKVFENHQIRNAAPPPTVDSANSWTILDENYMWATPATSSWSTTNYVSRAVLVEVNPDIIKSTPVPLNFSILTPYGQEYRKITKLITNRQLIVDRIEKVNNIFLNKAFKLKKEEKLSQFCRVEEQLLFHGTKHANVNNICTYNFDWRLRGSNKGHRYGQGISFSPNAKYASNYSDKHRGDKVIIIAKVLVASACYGTENMILPPAGFDTTTKADGIVTVKYEDSEYYPAYVMYYHFEME